MNTERGDDCQYQGHKLFASRQQDGTVVIEAVTDTVPVHRMEFVFSPEEAHEVARLIREVADG